MFFINITAPPYPFFTYSGYASYRPGDKHKFRKSFSYFNMLIVESGCLYMTVNGEPYELKRGTVIIIPPDVSYFGTKVCSEKTIFHWFHFSANNYTLSTKYDPHLNRLNNHTISYETFSFTLPVMQQLDSAVFDFLLDKVKQNETRVIDFYKGEDFTLNHKANILNQQENFFSILALLMHQQQQSNSNVIAENVFQYLHTNYSESISLNQLASSFACHPTHLIRCVKNTYGIPPKQLLLEIRLKKSCDLLLNSQDSITSISYKVGFSSPAYFCKQFKAHYKCSPKEYRKTRLKKTI